MEREIILFDRLVDVPFHSFGLPCRCTILKDFTWLAMGHIDIPEYCQESVFKYVLYVALSVHQWTERYACCAGSGTDV